MTEYDASPPETRARRFTVAADGTTTGDDGDSGRLAASLRYACRVAGQLEFLTGAGDLEWVSTVSSTAVTARVGWSLAREVTLSAEVETGEARAPKEFTVVGGADVHAALGPLHAAGAPDARHPLERGHHRRQAGRRGGGARSPAAAVLDSMAALPEVGVRALAVLGALEERYRETCVLLDYAHGTMLVAAVGRPRALRLRRQARRPGGGRDRRRGPGDPRRPTTSPAPTPSRPGRPGSTHWCAERRADAGCRPRAPPCPPRPGCGSGPSQPRAARWARRRAGVGGGGLASAATRPRARWLPWSRQPSERRRAWGQGTATGTGRARRGAAPVAARGLLRADRRLLHRRARRRRSPPARWRCSPTPVTWPPTWWPWCRAGRHPRRDPTRHHRSAHLRLLPGRGLRLRARRAAHARRVGVRRESRRSAAAAPTSRSPPTPMLVVGGARPRRQPRRAGPAARRRRRVAQRQGRLPRGRRRHPRLGRRARRRRGWSPPPATGSGTPWSPWPSGSSSPCAPSCSAARCSPSSASTCPPGWRST